MALKKLGKIGLIIALPILLLTGCSNNEDTVASLRGYKLNSTQFLNELNLIRSSYKIRTNSELTDEQTRTAASDTIEQLILLEIFSKEGEKLGLSPSEKEVEELFKSAKESISNIDGLQDILDSSGYTDEAIKESLAKTSTSNAYYDYLYNLIPISGADVQKFYEDNKDELYTTELADAAHILFKTFTEDEEGNRTPVSDKEKETIKKKAEDVLAKVKAGEDFNELAKKHSEDEITKESGGELGSFSKGQMVLEFENAAFGLKEGETSELVETDFGFHIVKLNSKDTNVYDYSDIESYVRQDLLDSLFNKKVKELEDKYNFKLYEDNINSILSSLEPVSIPSNEDSSEDEKVDSSQDENTETETEKSN